MRLTRVTLWNYRSFWSDADDKNDTPSADIALGAGVNYIVGPNNVGKSNLLRAIALAFDSTRAAGHEIDRPIGKKSGPVIILEFDAGPNPKPAVKKLLAEVEQYEQTIDGFQKPSLASENKIRFWVEILDDGRFETFLTRDSHADGKGASASHKRKRAVERFHEVVRFVDIHSGEDLKTLLERGFKEVLANALTDEHGKAMKEAEAAREAYQEALGRTLRLVGKHIEDSLKLYVPDILEVDPQVLVPPVMDALANAQFVIEDAVKTSLDQKGTGVRGAMLLLLLSFIAERSKNAVVFGIEEPESFLHPDAHKQLGEGLERFTARDDISLIVTTHSPFLFKPKGKTDRSKVFVVRKNDEGRSTIEHDQKGDARADLLGSRALASLLERAEEVPAKAKMILLVEGDRDIDYLGLASRKLNIPIADMFILPRGSGSSGALSAVTMAARHAPGKVVVALYDSDSNGKDSYDILTERFSWKKKAKEGVHALMYDRFVEACGVPVEAEDLFSNATMDAFLAKPGHKKFVQGSKLRAKTGAWHYDLDSDGKNALVAWLDENGDAETFKLWKPVLEYLRGLVT